MRVQKIKLWNISYAKYINIIVELQHASITLALKPDIHNTDNLFISSSFFFLNSAIVTHTSSKTLLSVASYNNSNDKRMVAYIFESKNFIPPFHKHQVQPKAFSNQLYSYHKNSQNNNTIHTDPINFLFLYCSGVYYTFARQQHSAKGCLIHNK